MRYNNADRSTWILESPAFWYAVKMVAENKAIFVLDGVRVQIDDERAMEIMRGHHFVKYINFGTNPIEIIVVKEGAE